MSIIVGELKSLDDKYSADYIKIGNEEVIVTSFLNEFLSSSVTEFKAYEEDEEVIYKEIKEEDIDELSNKANDIIMDMLIKSKQEPNNIQDQLINNIIDLTKLKNIFLIFYKSCANCHDAIKILVI